MDAIFANQSTSNDRKRHKRVADESIVLSDDDNDGNFPSFIVVEAADGQPIKYSIFGIQKLLKCAVGDVKSAKKLRNGAVLIEVTSKAQADKALRMTTWVDVEVKVSPHRSLNMSKGIIRCRDLRDCSEEEVLDALRPEGVTNVKHIFANKNGVKQPTNTFVLTFAKPAAPKFVKAAYLKIPVEMFIPNPLRCFNCQRFGHGKNSCNRAAICAKCSQQGHVDADCKEEPRCANCSGPHPAFSKECPEWMKQREIMKIKTERCASFGEAKQMYEQQPQSSSAACSASSRRPGTSYATAVKATRCMSTQTEFTWPADSATPVMITKGITGKENAESQTSSDVMSIPAAVGGNSSASHISRIPHSTPKIKIQLNAKPGPASSKLGFAKKQSKGSADPIKLFNKFGSLDDMDLEVNLSPGRGPGGRRKS
jgi:hypothetical protein